MNRKRLIIVGVAILIMAGLITVCGLGVQWWRKNHQPQAHQRQLVTNLTYCDSNDIKPCVTSFSVDADGNMLVNLVIPDSDYLAFDLTIGLDDIVNQYNCQQVKDAPTNVTCTGVEMFPGPALQFMLTSHADHTVLAEGKFAIIGLLLPNPSDAATETPLATETLETTPTETPTPILLEILPPLPTQSFAITSVPTKVTPSYPNPSYP